MKFLIFSSIIISCIYFNACSLDSTCKGDNCSQEPKIPIIQCADHAECNPQELCMQNNCVSQSIFCTNTNNIECNCNCEQAQQQNCQAVTYSNSCSCESGYICPDCSCPTCPDLECKECKYTCPDCVCGDCPACPEFPDCPVCPECLPDCGLQCFIQYKKCLYECNQQGYCLPQCNCKEILVSCMVKCYK